MTKKIGIGNEEIGGQGLARDESTTRVENQGAIRMTKPTGVHVIEN